jgi:hypothetical protein
MADLIATAKSLIEALRSLGKEQDANDFKSEFEQINWQITHTELQRLLAAIYPPGAAQNTSPSETNPTTKNTTLQIHKYLQIYTKFTEAIKNSNAIIATLDQVARSRKFKKSTDLLHDLFTNILGYNSQKLNTTYRLGNQTTFSQLLTIASFDDFIISTALISTEVPYSTIYKSIFQLFPYGLCVVINTDRKIVRFVYSHYKQSGKREPAYRTLIGFPRGRAHNDNLLVWAHRLDLIRPSYDDNSSLLRDRIDDVIGCAPDALAYGWPSSSFEPTNSLDGPSWNELPVYEAESFLQPDATMRLSWGLEATLHDHFPMAVSRGLAHLHYKSYTIRNLSSKEANIKNKWETQVDLHLELVFSEAKKEELTIPCVIPIPDNRGHFWIEGYPYQFCPWVHKNGVLATNVIETDHEDLVEEYNQNPTSSNQLIVDDQNENDSTDESEFLEQPIESEKATIEGASIRVLLEISVSKRLSAFAARLWRIHRDYFEGKESVLQVMGYFYNSEGLIELASRVVLSSALTPIDRWSLHHPYRSIQYNPSETVLPPSWACLDSSTVVSPNTWLPIQSARLHPTGGLAIPIEDKSGWCLRITNKTALQDNQRLLSCSTTPAIWWVASQLNPWGDSRAGTVEGSDLLLRKGVASTLSRICIPLKNTKFENSWAGTNLFDNTKTQVGNLLVSQDTDEALPEALQVSPKYLDELQSSHTFEMTLVIEIPAIPDVKSPKLNKKLMGSQAKPGLTWMTTSHSSWAGAGDFKWPRKVEVLAKIIKYSLDENQIAFRLPPGTTGKICAMKLERQLGKYGGLVGWKASVQISQHPKYTRAILPNGRCIKIESLPIEDAPYSIELGHHEKIVLRTTTQPYFSKNIHKEERLLFCGQTGQPFECKFQEGTIAWIPQLPDTTNRVSSLEYRILDNEPIARSGMLSLTERQRRWLRLAYPELATLVENQVCRTNSNTAGWEPALGILMHDLGLVGLQTFVTKEAIVEGDSRIEEVKEHLTDPIRSQMTKYRIDKRGNLGGFWWQCQCGILSGVHHAFEICAACNTLVTESLKGANRWSCDCENVVRVKDTGATCSICKTKIHEINVPRSKLSRIHLPLPIPVIHPWYKQEMAAILGLELKELVNIFECHDPSTIISFAETALATDPEAAIRNRMSRESDKEKLRSFGLALHALRAWLKKGNCSLTLTKIPVVPSRYLLLGLPAGTPRLIHGELVRRYRDLRHAIEQVSELSDIGFEPVRISSHTALQHAVDELYGQLDSRSEKVDSLAALVARIWPLSRDDNLQTAIPGLTRINEEISILEAPQKHCTNGAPQNDCDTAQRIHKPLTLDLSIGFPVTDEYHWKERNAQHLLTGKYILSLAAIFAGIDPSRLTSMTKEELKVSEVELTDDIPTLGLRECLRAIANPNNLAHELLALLIPNLPISLPSAANAASDALSSRLKIALPSSDSGTRIAKCLLADILGGWWHHKPTAEDPLGWRREPADKTLPSPWKRAVPPLKSRAWLLWPNARSFLSPVESLLQIGTNHPLLSNALGKIAHIPSTVCLKANEGLENSEDSSNAAQELYEVVSISPESPIEDQPKKGIEANNGPQEETITEPVITSLQDSSASEVRILSSTISDWLRTNVFDKGHANSPIEITKMKRLGKEPNRKKNSPEVK